MMNIQKGLKSVLLALAVVVAMPNQKVSGAATAQINPVVAVIEFAKGHPCLVSAVIAFCAAAEFDIRTKAKAEYHWSEMPEDIKDLVASNVLSSSFYKKMLAMVRKYGFGLAVKLDEQTVRTRNEDGSITTVKSKKLTQKPFGVYGLFDAYALMHMKKFTEYVPVVAGFYVLLTNPNQVIEGAAVKAEAGSNK